MWNVNGKNVILDLNARKNQISEWRWHILVSSSKSLYLTFLQEILFLKNAIRTQLLTTIFRFASNGLKIVPSINLKVTSKFNWEIPQAPPNPKLYNHAEQKKIEVWNSLIGQLLNIFFNWYQRNGKLWFFDQTKLFIEVSHGNAAVSMLIYFLKKSHKQMFRLFFLFFKTFELFERLNLSIWTTPFIHKTHQKHKHALTQIHSLTNCSRVAAIEWIFSSHPDSI